MNKKFLSAILFGALMVTSTGTFVSCKDYDEDIDSINKELTDIKSQLAALQTKVDAGKWITSVSSTANGVAITMSDGQTLNITNGKDGQNGAQGEAGKNGTVVTVNENGVLCLDGVETAIKVAEEAPAALPCVKVSEAGELMVLGAEGEYVATGIKPCGVIATNTKGVWTIQVGEDVITVPGSAALTSIAIQDAPEYYNYYYAVVNEAKKWGWNEEETMPAGFYTKLSQDVDVLLNPAEADGKAFTYTFKNSLGVAADVDFFGEARRSTTILTRAASENGLWTLPAVVTSKPAADSETLRRELYLNFKQNDDKEYALTLEAADLLGNAAVRSDYAYAIKLAKAPADGAIAAPNGEYCMIGETYYPVVTGAVYDYKIRVNKAYERLAKVYGVTTDGKSFSAASETAMYNTVVFDYALVNLTGKATTGTFEVYFTNEMISASTAIQAEALKAPMDASLALNTPNTFVFNGGYSCDLTEQINALDATTLMLWTEAIKEESYSAELIGGETETGDNNYNEVAVNKYLEENAMSWSIDHDQTKGTYTLNANFKVDADYDYNFQLNTAYQLNIVVKDPQNQNVTIATVEFPFEFTQPTLDITQVDGEFTKWVDNYSILRYGDEAKTAAKATMSTERALLVFGVKGESNNNMYLPLYDSFTAWKAKNGSTVTGNFQKYVDNAQYYNLHFHGYEPARILSKTTQTIGTPYNYVLKDNLDYSSRFEKLNTWALYADVNAAATNSTVATRVAKVNGTPTFFYEPYELSTEIEVCYKHYGVYEAFDHTKFNDGKVNGADFNLVFASWLGHSTLKMKEESYSTERGTHTLFISNKDLNFTTPKGDAFYLFDGISANGKVVERADLNAAFNEVEQHPFTTVSKLFAANSGIAVNFTAKEADGQQETLIVGMNVEPANPCTMDIETGELTLDHSKFAAAQGTVQIYPVSSYAKVANSESATGVQQAFEGGMVIVLPKSIQDGQSAIITVTLKDAYGYAKKFDIEVEKL